MWFKKGLLVFVQALFILIAVEFILHIIRGDSSPLTLINPNPRPHDPDKQLGWVLKEGVYTQAINDTFWTATHLNRYGRTTKKHSSTDTTGKPIISIYGDSFTYGDCLDDSFTFPYLIQTKLSDFNVLNKGVGGYSLVQCYLSLKRDIALGVKPKVVILNTASFINMRNVAHPVWLSYLFSELQYQKVSQINLPYLESDGDSFKIKFISGNSIRRGLLLYRVSSVYKTLRDWVTTKQAPSFKNQSASSAYMIGKFHQLSKEYDFHLLVTYFTDDDGMNESLRVCKELNIDTVNLAVPLNGYYSIPNNSHPNSIANKLYAQKIVSALRQRKIVR